MRQRCRRGSSRAATRETLPGGSCESATSPASRRSQRSPELIKPRAEAPRPKNEVLRHLLLCWLRRWIQWLSCSCCLDGVVSSPADPADGAWSGIDQRGCFRRREILAVGRHVAAALKHLADELILCQACRDVIQCRSALSAHPAERVAVAALLGLEDDRALPFDWGQIVQELRREPCRCSRRS